LYKIKLFYIMTNQPTEEQVELSKEEIAQRREEITAFYKLSIDHLKVQLEYETLLKDIETARAERIQAQIFLANALSGEKGNKEAKEEFEQDLPQTRKLKVQ